MTATPCPHPGARVLGYHGLHSSDAGNRGEPWRLHGEVPGELATWETYTTLGRCGACDQLVVHVGTWDQAEPWSVDYGRHSDVTVGWVGLTGRYADAPGYSIDRGVDVGMAVLDELGVDLGPDADLILAAAVQAAVTGGDPPTIEQLRRWRAPRRTHGSQQP